MIFIFNLITIAIATTFFLFTTQVPYKGFDVQPKPNYGFHNDEPMYSLQELYNLDGREPKSKRVIMRARKGRGKKASGKESYSIRQIYENSESKPMIVLRSKNPPKLQPSPRHSPGGGWMTWTGDINDLLDMLAELPL